MPINNLNSLLKRVDSYGLNINRFNAKKNMLHLNLHFFPFIPGPISALVVFVIYHSMLTFSLNNTDDYNVLVNEVLRSKTYK